MRYALAALAILSVLLVAGCGTRNAGPPTQEECNRFMDKTLRSQCMYNMSVANNNPTYCKDIPDLGIRAKCVDDISIKLGNDMYCMNNERLSVKEECERKVAAAMRAKKEQNATGVT